jgi:hypothetical protein
MRGGSHTMPKRRRSFLAAMAARSLRTAQEELVADMLRSVGFHFHEQWVLTACGEGMIFDFLVEQRVLVECSSSSHPNCYNAWQVLKRRAAFFDYKFRLAKRVGTFTTISLLEATNCTGPRTTTEFPFIQTARNLESTNHIVTSIPVLGELLINLDVQSGFEAQPSVSHAHLDAWLSAPGSSSRNGRHGRFERASSD